MAPAIVEAVRVIASPSQTGEFEPAVGVGVPPEAQEAGTSAKT